MKRIYFFLTLLMANLPSFAQCNMEDSMYSSGKINVVIAVVLIILLLLFIYLFRLDKKVGKMEE